MERPLEAFMKVTIGPILSIIPSIIVGVGIFLVAEGALGTRTERGGLLVLVAAVFLALYGVMVVWSKTLSSDDRGFIEGVMPARLKYFLRFL